MKSIATEHFTNDENKSFDDIVIMLNFVKMCALHKFIIIRYESKANFSYVILYAYKG